MKFNEYKGLNLPKIAAEISDCWEENDTFLKSVKNREGNPDFVFLRGSSLCEWNARYSPCNGTYH